MPLTSHMRRLTAILAAGLLVTATLWLGWARWGWPRGAANGGQRNDNAIFVGTALLTVYLAGVALWWSTRQGHGGKADGADPIMLEDRTEPSTFEVKIGEDGHFVGGEEAVTLLVVEMLDVPVGSRSIRVKAEPLENENYRREHPNEYLLLRKHVRAYEVSLGRLMRGTIHYYLQWEVEDLVEAILELRRIELPSQRDRQSWYCWDPEKPENVVCVGFDATYVESVQTGYYGPVTGGQLEFSMGLPTDEPIWIVSLFPSVVWQRVVPAVVADRRKRHPDPPDPAVLDITRWVVSDHKPGDLAGNRPSREPQWYDPAAWQW